MSQQFVIPSDRIPIDADPNTTIMLGTNLSYENGVLHPGSAGTLHQKNNGKSPAYYLEYNSKRYIPQLGDFVLGTVVGSFGEYYRVSLNNFSAPVLLNQFSFPNASKKNRPHLDVGDLVYARVSAVIPNVDTEIACIDPTTGKDGGFGVLKEGFAFDVKLAFARYLLFDPNAPILQELAKRCKFEIATGVNGKIWIQTDSVRSTIACVNCIKESQHWTQAEIPAKVEAMFAKFKETS